jgi:NAD(P)-dependent dehydrogenase (short-subunit alcohol dehydrogenase family)
MGSLNGKAALVTGGGRGIGAAIARRLAAEGADVAITYAGSLARAEGLAAEIAATGRRAIALRADNRDAQAVEAAVAQAVEAFGRIDILVNNAGIYDAAPIQDLSLQAFDDTFAINVRAVFVATRAALAHMPDGGRVISIGSSLAERAPFGGQTIYSASKAAVVAFTQALARDVGARGITANVVNPGSTDTEMNPADGDHAAGQRDLMAIPRFGTAEDVAGLVAWLAGPEARSVTGAAFRIDGGANA